MLEFSTAINFVRQNVGFKSNDYESLFYRTYTIQGSKPIQVM